MSNTSPTFDFSQFVPGFDFLKNLASAGAASPAAGAGAVPGMPGLASWVAPTLSVEEVDKRIQELKTVQYWLEQNGHALKATIQALEVQKMTLSTLRGMNVRMEDIASAFTKPAGGAASSAPEEKAAEEKAVEKTAPPASDGEKAASGGGVVDPMQWWGSLTEQFQQIAASALQEAAQLKMPVMPQPMADAAGQKARGKPAAASAAKPAPAKKRASAPAKKKATAAPKRSATRR